MKHYYIACIIIVSVFRVSAVQSYEPVEPFNPSNENECKVFYLEIMEFIRGLRDEMNACASSGEKTQYTVSPCTPGQGWTFAPESCRPKKAALCSALMKYDNAYVRCQERLQGEDKSDFAADTTEALNAMRPANTPTNRISRTLTEQAINGVKYQHQKAMKNLKDAFHGFDIPIQQPPLGAIDPSAYKKFQESAKRIQQQRQEANTNNANHEFASEYDVEPPQWHGQPCTSSDRALIENLTKDMRDYSDYFTYPPKNIVMRRGVCVYKDPWFPLAWD